ncbi:MAG: PHP-associated domain-containing protein [Betaproteobacteria bacterium]
MALRRIKADLHVHTCLSPCSSLDMSPRELVSAALRKNIDLLGVCDHNSAENVLAVKKAGVRNGLMVLGGMEVASSEEAHILVFFDEDDDLLGFQDYIYRHLVGRNDERSFGLQVIADDEDGVTGFCDRLLIAATSLPAETIVEAAREAKGENLVIAAHVDRESFSIIGQLGFIPPSLDLDAVEVSAQMTAADAMERFLDCRNYPVITGSDAHDPEDIGRRFTWFTVEDGTVAEIKKALAGRDGRKMEC